MTTFSPSGAARFGRARVAPPQSAGSDDQDYDDPRVVAANLQRATAAARARLARATSGRWRD
ncbi:MULTISPECIES: hypothetical protein [unclassified Curtobacterium]|uniref:hypothetical protein n=1 Tax=unclassified Curtobacterium TaxID=257496 RepID=UPI000DA7B945|nr:MULTISPECIES: hypothetical protein [unclassified Curtobacterium]PZE36532.1 hypothetical protein DEJ31_09185 [Curtobacterium sp. MCPF17_031]PZF10675.1 hypothetical protein DEJ25_12685 [Curtobacterium sp. MCPF17_011]